MTTLADAMVATALTFVEHPFGWFPRDVKPYAAERGWPGPDTSDCYDAGATSVEFEVMELRGYTKDPINGVIVRPVGGSVTQDELRAALVAELGSDGDLAQATWELPECLIDIVYNGGYVLGVYPPDTLTH